MLTPEIDDLLTLLALTIFADNRVYAEEVDTFMSESQNLQIAREIDPRVTEAKLLSWFETHRESLKVFSRKDDFDVALTPILKRLMPLKGKTLILDAMHRISISDGEVHKKEKHLIDFSAKYWNIEYNQPSGAAVT